MKQNSITIEGLLNDPNFRSWVLSPDSEEARRYQEWVNAQTGNREKFTEAKELLLAMKPKEIDGDVIKEDKVWSLISEGIQGKSTQQPKTVSVIKFSWKVAASLAVGLLGSALIYFWLFTSSYVSINTAYGEVKEIQLPDSSWVVLNANSSLEYDEDWDNGADREVWLEGEAFFKVKKRLSGLAQPHETSYIKFTVHADPLDVEVLGTEFSVNHRGENTQIVLNEGKVLVRDIQHEQEDVVLKPGEMLSYTKKDIQLSLVDAGSKISWKDELVIFRNETLTKIFKRIEDTYGYEIELHEKEILDYRFSGSYPRDSVDILLDKLEKLYQLNIQKNATQIKVTK